MHLPEFWKGTKYSYFVLVPIDHPVVINPYFGILCRYVAAVKHIYWYLCFIAVTKELSSFYAVCSLSL